MIVVKHNKTRPLALMLLAFGFLSMFAACELTEPRRPVFQPTPLSASPTPVYPSAPIDSGVNDEPCGILADGLSQLAKSDLRYGAKITFKKAMEDLQTVSELLGESGDLQLISSIDGLHESIELNDAKAAEAHADAAVRRCKELGYGRYMAPFGYRVW
jgi:hypothetical protein